MASHNIENKKKVAKTISLLIDDKNQVPEFIQFFLVDRLLWAATEYDDNEKFNKYFGVPYWSRGAIEKILSNITNKTKVDKDLVHEHSIPKCVIGEMLDKMYEDKRTSKEYIFELLDKFCHAVVVCKEEDTKINKSGFRSKMPASFSFNDGDDVFCRYKLSGVEVFSLSQTDLIDFSKGKIPDIDVSQLYCNKIC